jgi:hypothetical protein
MEQADFLPGSEPFLQKSKSGTTGEGRFRIPPCHLSISSPRSTRNSTIRYGMLPAIKRRGVFSWAVFFRQVPLFVGLMGERGVRLGRGPQLFG